MYAQRTAAATVAALLTWPAPAGASADSQTDDGAVSRSEFERRLTEIEAKHQADLEARDREIEALQKELRDHPVSKPTKEEDAWTQERKQTVERMLAEIDQERALTTAPRTPVSFNPDFAVVSDFLGTWSDDKDNDAYNRFDVREVELDLRAAVDPHADGVVVLAFARDVENPPFPTGEELEGPETSVEVEEAYLFLHDFGIPNLTAKIGRFHLRFGRQNILHLHDLPTSDPSFVNQAFLAPEALTDSGVSLSYLIPNPWDQYLEAVVEVISGEGAGSESPVLGGDLQVDSPAFNTHLLWNLDLAPTWNAELGTSWLHGRADNENTLEADLIGGDLTLLHRDPTGGFNNHVLQGEFIHGIVDQADGSIERSWGAYLLAQQQFSKDWYGGIRLDWSEDPNASDQDIYGVSPYVSWYWSEFLRFRVEFQHREGDVPDANVVYFQFTWIFGAHPPHPYWAMR